MKIQGVFPFRHLPLQNSAFQPTWSFSNSSMKTLQKLGSKACEIFDSGTVQLLDGHTDL
jgi:hypothetical protein